MFKPSCKKLRSWKNQIKLFLPMWSNCFFKEKPKRCNYVHQKVFPTLCSNSRFTDCFSSSAAIKGENSAQCSLTWKKVKVESYPFSGNRFPKIFKTPSPLLLLPPLLTSQSNLVDSPPPCSCISMTNPSESPLPNIGHFCTKLAVISVQNRFVGRSVSCQWLTIGQRMPCPGEG